MYTFCAKILHMSTKCSEFNNLPVGYEEITTYRNYFDLIFNLSL